METRGARQKTADIDVQLYGKISHDKTHINFHTMMTENQTLNNLFKNMMKMIEKT